VTGRRAPQRKQRASGILRDGCTPGSAILLRLLTFCVRFGARGTD
jgi:hypothetical protein